MNVFLASPITRRVEATTKQGSSTDQGLLQQDGRRNPGASDSFAAVLARLSSRSA